MGRAPWSPAQVVHRSLLKDGGTLQKGTAFLDVFENFLQFFCCLQHEPLAVALCILVDFSECFAHAAETLREYRHVQRCPLLGWQFGFHDSRHFHIDDAIECRFIVERWHRASAGTLASEEAGPHGRSAARQCGQLVVGWRGRKPDVGARFREGYAAINAEGS